MCPPSPLSALALQRLRPPSSAAWAEFLNASANGKMERDFALLTLTDGEQRELYEAARIIQNAFRRYKVLPAQILAGPSVRTRCPEGSYNRSQKQDSVRNVLKVLKGSVWVHDGFSCEN